MFRFIDTDNWKVHILVQQWKLPVTAASLLPAENTNPARLITDAEQIRRKVASILAAGGEKKKGGKKKGNCVMAGDEQFLLLYKTNIYLLSDLHFNISYFSSVFCISFNYYRKIYFYNVCINVLENTHLHLPVFFCYI